MCIQKNRCYCSLKGLAYFFRPFLRAFVKDCSWRTDSEYQINVSSKQNRVQRPGLKRVTICTTKSQCQQLHRLMFGCEFIKFIVLVCCKRLSFRQKFNTLQAVLPYLLCRIETVEEKIVFCVQTLDGNFRKMFTSNNQCSLCIIFLKSCQLNQERGDSDPRGLRLQKSHPRGSSVCSNRSELTTRSYVPLLYHARALCSTTGNSYSACSDRTKSSLLGVKCSPY